MNTITASINVMCQYFSYDRHTKSIRHLTYILTFGFSQSVSRSFLYHPHYLITREIFNLAHDGTTASNVLTYIVHLQVSTRYRAPATRRNVGICLYSHPSSGWTVPKPFLWLNRVHVVMIPYHFH